MSRLTRRRLPPLAAAAVLASGLIALAGCGGGNHVAGAGDAADGRGADAAQDDLGGDDDAADGAGDAADGRGADAAQDGLGGGGDDAPGDVVPESAADLRSDVAPEANDRDAGDDAGAGRDAGEGRDASADGAGNDGPADAHPDVPDTARDAAPADAAGGDAAGADACSPPSGPTFLCGGLVTCNGATSYCRGSNHPSTCEPLPAECQCAETHTCACLVAHASIPCDGGALTCTSYDGGQLSALLGCP